MKKSPEAIKVEKEKFAMECEEKPWLRGVEYDDIKLREFCDGPLREALVACDLWYAKMAYEKFINDSVIKYPELTSKRFGFTLDSNAQVLIIDYEGDLTGEEIETLTELINNAGGLKASLQQSAKSLMALVRYDETSQHGQDSLTYANFSSAIDFRKVLSSLNKDLLSEAFRQIYAATEGCSPPQISVLA